tara:strand:- start:569 stop:826 length:258 start_codon:yes stop_codon:yes gene_type:complete
MGMYRVTLSVGMVISALGVVLQTYYIIIEEWFLNLKDYHRLQNPINKWEISREQLNLIDKYFKITELKDRDHSLMKKIDKFAVYA